MKDTHFLRSSLSHSAGAGRAAHRYTRRYLVGTINAHENAIESGSLNPATIHYQSTASLPDAHKLLDELSGCNDVVSATSLLGRLAKLNRHNDAAFLFSRMVERNIKPNEFTFGTMIQSSVVGKNLALGKQFHARAVKTGLNSNVFVGSSFLNLYVKFGSVREAEKAFEDTDHPNVVSFTALINGYLKEERFDEATKLFEKMPERNVVSWNAMISGCSQTGKNEEAVSLFVEMLREGHVPSDSSFPNVIMASANIAALGMGRSFHACALKFLGNVSVFVGNSLVSFYAKCGSTEDCLLAFDKLPEKNVVSWNAVICGLAQNGKAKEALDMYREMKSSGFQPNGVTLLGLLLACNHVGLVDEGYSYFNEVRLSQPKTLQAEHYACVVDLFSRSGRFKEAVEFMSDLPFDPGVGFWKAVLGGCRIHSNAELAAYAAGKIRELDPGDVSSFVMLSNAHSAAGRWQSASAARDEMWEKGLSRVPGCSWIEVKDEIRVFVTGDRRHPRIIELIKVLSGLLEHIIVIQDIDFGCIIP